MRRAFAVFTLAMTLLLAWSGSLYYVEGPEVTCADLGCGQVNACANGIIAQCVDGKTVR